MTTRHRSGEPKPSTTLHTLHVDPAAPFNRLHALLYASAILALVYHRAVAAPFPLLPNSLLLIADLVLALMWATSQAFLWRPVRRREYPERLLEAIGGEQNLPGLDVFVCTADPHKEPPMSVASTALSALAFDYPADRLSVYVSDDGGSELTLFAFMEAARFARHWLPFCRENGIKQRSPEVYFGSSESEGSDEMKMMYQTMKIKVDGAVECGYVSNNLFNTEKECEIFQKWKGCTRTDHPSIIQVLLESNKDIDIKGKTMPSLVYVSREKCGTVSHNFKAGALNTLIRVSGIISDAPILLTLDCDMNSNDPLVPYRALCYMMDSTIASSIAFVQFPQSYQGINKGDIYGGELKHLFYINARGLDGLRGPNYVGTCCFHLRRSFYGIPSLPLQTIESCNSKESRNGSISYGDTFQRAHEVASCTYEVGTKWGSLIGFRYGSLVEDYLTGYRLHCEGWSSVFCDPESPSFLGDAPKSLNDSLSQCQRWIVGLYEVVFSKYSPLTFGTRKASFLMGLGYTHYAFWGNWAIPMLIYAVVPQLALTYAIPVFPKISEPWFYLYAYLFIAAYGQDLVVFLTSKGTFERWWNNQRIWMIRGLTSFPFAIVQYVMKQIGFTTQGFNVTSKVMADEQNRRYEKGLLEFGMVSPFFISIGTISITNLASLIIGAIRVVRKTGTFDMMFVQLFLSGFGVMNSWPIYEAMFFRRDEGRMPTSVTNFSIFLSSLIYFIGHFMFTV